MTKATKGPTKGPKELDNHAEHHKSTETVKSEAGEAKPPGVKHGDAKHADAKQHSQPQAVKAKAHDPLPGGCFSWGCKAHATQFNFCSEHFDHFKFGLIKKTGEPVSDYEKKFGHYMAHKRRRSVQKAA